MSLEREGPQLGFDRLLAELVTQGTVMMTTRSRLRELIAVNRELTSHLDLPTVLRRIVEIGVALVGSQHAVMVGLGPDDTAPRFVHGTLTDEQVATVRAALAAVQGGEESHGAVRLEVALDGPGADDGTRPTSVVAVPIVVRGVPFGALFLVDPVAEAFSADDEELALALADSASIAIENARLYEESKDRERVAASIAKLSRQMSRWDDDDPVDALLTEMQQHLDADMINVSLLDDDRTHMYVESAQGFGAESVTQTTFPIAGSPLRETMMANEDKVTRVEDISTELPYGFEELRDLGSFIAVPFVVERETAGFLCAVRTVGRHQFDERDSRTAEAFATLLSSIFERERARETQRRVTLLEDRERIAQDLHDHVIQRLFAVGMNLGTVVGAVGADPARSIERQIDEIDGAIRQIRQSIFAIRASGESRSTLRTRVMEVAQRTGGASLRPSLTFVGPVDLLVDDELGDDVVAVVTEAVSNAVRHAQASRIDVVVRAVDGELQVEVSDDGVGVPDDVSRSGLDNLRRRAERRGGRFDLGRAPTGGTRLAWTAPLGSRAPTQTPAA